MSPRKSSAHGKQAQVKIANAIQNQGTAHDNMDGLHSAIIDKVQDHDTALLQLSHSQKNHAYQQLAEKLYDKCLSELLDQAIGNTDYFKGQSYDAKVNECIDYASCVVSCFGENGCESSCHHLHP